MGVPEPFGADKGPQRHVRMFAAMTVSNGRDICQRNIDRHVWL